MVFTKKLKHSKFFWVNDFETLLEDFSSFYSVDFSGYNLRGIVFYGDNVGIDLADFRNLTLIILDNDGYAKYISYEKQENDLVLVENNAQKHSFIMMNYFGYLGAKLNLNNNSMLTVMNKKDFGLTVDSQIAVNVQAQNIEKTVIDEYETIPYSLNGGHWCTNEGCDSTSRGFCGPNVEGNGDMICNASSYVEDRECADDELGIQDDYIAPYPTVTGYKAAMYSIRDNFLLTTSKGKEYVDYYYKLSYSFKVLNLYETKGEDLADIMYRVRLKSVQYLIASSDDIILDNEEYNYLKERINEFKVLSSNKEYRYIFNKMDNDLDYLKNKTKAQLQNYFND